MVSASIGEATTPSKPASASQPGPPQHQILRCLGDALLAQVLHIQAGQNRDGEELGGGIAPAAQRGIEGLPVGAVHREKGDAEFGGGGGGPLHGIGDIKELCVQEDAASLGDQLARQDVTAGIDQFEPDLEGQRQAAELRHQRARRRRIGKIERNDQPAGRSGGGHGRNRADIMASLSMMPDMVFWTVSSLALPASSNASLAFEIGN